MVRWYRMAALVEARCREVKRRMNPPDPADSLPAGAECGRVVRVTGTVHLGMGCAEAFPYFTPRGERAWAEDWDPTFPAGTADDTAPGTVFEVTHGELRETWIVCTHEPGRGMTYARVRPGSHAGTVSVALAPAGTGCAATVEYRLTALTDAGVRELHRFAANYSAFLRHWETAISRAHHTSSRRTS